MTANGRGFLVEAGTGRPTRVPIPNMLLKAVGTDTKGAYALCEYMVTYDIPAHTHHREDEAVFVLDGAVTIRVGDELFTLDRGDFLFMPQGVPHSIQMASEESIRILALSSPSGFEYFMEDLTEVLSTGHDRTSAEVSAVMTKHQWQPVSLCQPDQALAIMRV